MTELTIAAICHLLETRGTERAPLASITILDHALQTAWFAERGGASPSLVSACLLHDLGHLIDGEAMIDGQPVRGHGPRAAVHLDKLFGIEVTDPIRLHVAAKRYLCYSHPGYAHSLTPYAVQSLQRQGGAFTPDEARAFMREPHAIDAVNLRLWDDKAHTSGIDTPGLPHFAATLRTCVLMKGSLYVADERN